MTLHGKVVFMTNADDNSGETLIKRLADEGAHFILNSVSDGKDIQESLAYCQSQGVKTTVVNVDLSKSSEVKTMLERVAPQIGTVDVFIHNTNVVIPTSVETCDEETFLKVMDRNTKSAFICTKEVGKQMAEKESGRIIYISSIHAEKPTGSSFVYSVSRGALKLLARESALYLGRYGVNVNAIELGPIDGDDEKFTSHISKLYDDYQYKVPSTRLGNDDDLADLVLYLASDHARYINGADIRLDGGFLLHYMDHKMKKPTVRSESHPS
ncbi:NAD(P)-dependent dehydrogenase (short-subunit alcohol dehydrogenase family) [Pullulanibacillus pueri]|uniref:3-oxoacyl-ACP reductase n=1 Tax=Pullulanibacillus pueri TaxID=1437324 RepID=A0A8J3EK39_9BACL|nr:SDR family oxidoreductase [Pullulanibacillus pueri]MBM7681808.1 NAD(P)-dependent dehydrogenase (short-subunit alcohol dehydrogenase family) [Pullulanibacillus pueri]GGH76168.1 3-oxoacyl-ACP reductase [Pullulanibacillus pueri]